MKLTDCDREIITSVCDKLVNLGIADHYDYVAGGVEYASDVYEVEFSDWLVLISRDFYDDAEPIHVQALCNGEPIDNAHIVIGSDLFNHITLGRATTAVIGRLMADFFDNGWTGEASEGEFE